MLILPPRIAQKYAKIKRAKKIADQIKADVAKVYPGHPFQFEVDYENGYVFVDHMLLAGNQARYFIERPDDTETIVKFCGELLERVNLPREALRDYSQINDAMSLSGEAFKAR